MTVFRPNVYTGPVMFGRPITTIFLVILSTGMVDNAWSLQAGNAASFSGRWKESSYRYKYKVVSWGDSCGYKPENRSRRGGHTLEIKESASGFSVEGSTLPLGSKRCPTDNREARFIGYKHGSRTVTCSTAPGNTKSQKGRYSYRLIDENTLRLTGRVSYLWSLKGTDCKVDETMTMTMRRLTPPPASPQETPCASVGEVVRLQIRSPSRTVRRGDKVCFKARGFDRNDCSRSMEVKWSVTSGPAVQTGKKGCVKIADDASPEGETVVISATAGKTSAKMRLKVMPSEVSSPLEWYFDRKTNRSVEELALGEESTSYVVISQGSSWTLIWLLVLLGAILVLGVTIILLLKGGRRRRARKHKYPPGTKVCPRCRKSYARSMNHCPLDGTRLVSTDPGGNGKKALRTMECPTCHRGFEEGASFCPIDATKLKPATTVHPAEGQPLLMMPSSAATPVRDGENVCPICSTRYDRNAAFCGKDGSKLKQIN